jgi:hypothetical protein
MSELSELPGRPHRYDAARADHIIL